MANEANRAVQVDDADDGYGAAVRPKSEVSIELSYKIMAMIWIAVVLACLVS